MRKILRFEFEQKNNIAQNQEQDLQDNSWLENDKPAVVPELMEFADNTQTLEYQQMPQSMHPYIEEDIARNFEINSLCIYQKNNQYYLVENHELIELKQDDRLILAELVLIVHFEDGHERYDSEVNDLYQSPNNLPNQFATQNVPGFMNQEQMVPDFSSQQTMPIAQYQPTTQLSSQSLLPELSGSDYPNRTAELPIKNNHTQTNAHNSAAGNILKDLGLFDDRAVTHTNTELEYASFLNTPETNFSAPAAKKMPNNSLPNTSLFAEDNYLPIRNTATQPSRLKNILQKIGLNND